MRRRAAATIAALVAAAATAACGTESSDLFIIERGGNLPDANVTMLVKDELTVECDGRREAMTEEQLLEARDLARDLEPLMADSLRLRQGKESLLGFRVTGSEGTVTFFDSSPGLRPELARIVKLSRDLAKGSCGLQR